MLALAIFQIYSIQIITKASNFSVYFINPNNSQIFAVKYSEPEITPLLGTREGSGVSSGRGVGLF